MKKDDARTLKPEVQEQLRKHAIRLRKRGMSFIDIGKIVGVRCETVGKWWRLYQEGGAKRLRARKRGRQVGSGRSLSPEQETILKADITDKTPDQLKLSFALWTRRAVQEHIHRLWGIKMPIRTVGAYLQRWGFTPQKPLKQAYEQQPKEVRKWLDERYPAIVEKAMEEEAEIHWGDETGLRNDCQHGRGYSPKGKTPVIRLSARRKRMNMISTVTNQGKVRFMIYGGTMNAKILIRFMKRLIKGADRKLYLILDNLRVHHSKPVKEWLGSHKEEIEVFFLPSYSPELNPDEYLNCDLKAGVHSSVPAKDEKELSKKIRSHMRMLQRKPGRVRKYFKHEKIAYAA